MKFQGEKKIFDVGMREKLWLVDFCTRPDGEPNLQPRHVLGLELNQQPCSLQDDTQLTEPHWSGLKWCLRKKNHEGVKSATFKKPITQNSLAWLNSWQAFLLQFM